MSEDEMEKKNMVFKKLDLGDFIGIRGPHW